MKTFLIMMFLPILLGCQPPLVDYVESVYYCSADDRDIILRDNYKPDPPDWIVITETVCADLEDQSIVVIEKRITTFLQRKEEYWSDGFLCKQMSYMCHSGTMERVEWNE